LQWHIQYDLKLICNTEFCKLNFYDLTLTLKPDPNNIMLYTTRKPQSQLSKGSYLMSIR